MGSLNKEKLRETITKEKSRDAFAVVWKYTKKGTKLDYKQTNEYMERQGER